MKGKRPAIHTAKTVMVSAARAMGLRQPARKQVQNGRNEGARVGDTDPEDEVDQVSAPSDRDVLPAHADADCDLIGPAGRAGEHPRKSNATTAQYLRGAGRRVFNTVCSIWP